MGSIPGLGRSPGEGNDYPLLCSYLENSTDRGNWWVTVHGFAKVWQDGATNTFTFTIIILFEAWGKENTNILTCLFSHVTCIHRGYRILPPWLLEIRYKDVAFFSIFFFFFHFDALECLKLTLLKSSLTRLQLFHWGKDLNLKRCFPFRSARELCPLSFLREPKGSEAVLFALGSWRQLWCWPARDAQLSIRANFLEEEGSCINGLSTETSFLKGCFFQLITMFLSKKKPSLPVIGWSIFSVSPFKSPHYTVLFLTLDIQQGTYYFVEYSEIRNIEMTERAIQRWINKYTKDNVSVYSLLHIVFIFFSI